MSSKLSSWSAMLWQIAIINIFISAAISSASYAAPMMSPSSRGDYIVCGTYMLPQGITSNLSLADIDAHPILSRLRREARIMLLIAKQNTNYRQDEIAAIERGIASRIVNIPSAYTMINPDSYTKTFLLRNSTGSQVKVRLNEPEYLEDSRGYRYNISTQRISQKLYCSQGWGRMLARTVTRISTENPRDAYGREQGSALMYLIEEVGLDKYDIVPHALQAPPWI